MAVEKNNTNESNSEFSADFDAALRRHLKLANHAAFTKRTATSNCAGFNPELASAYVENSLGATAREHYQAHLADCVTCRRQTVEFFRIMAQEPEPVPVVKKVVAEEKQVSWWSRWFDLSQWKLSPLALGGALAAIALAVAVPIVWQQAFTGQDAARTATNQTTPSVENVPTPGTGVTESISAGASVATPTPATIPAAKTGTTGSKDQSVPMPATTPVLSGSATGTAALPPPVTAETAGRADSQTATNQVAAPPAPAAGMQSDNNAQNAPQTRRETSSQTASGASADTAAKQAPADNDKKVAQVSEPSESVKDTNPPGLKVEKPKTPGSAYELKEKDVEEVRKSAKKEIAPGRARAMTRNIGNKTFTYEKGIWRDSAIEAGAKWPVIRLNRGSEAYEQTITDMPSLKPFFTQLSGVIIVLWNGNIYELH